MESSTALETQSENVITVEDHVDTEDHETDIIQEDTHQEQKDVAAAVKTKQTKEATRKAAETPVDNKINKTIILLLFLLGLANLGLGLGTAFKSDEFTSDVKKQRETMDSRIVDLQDENNALAASLNASNNDLQNENNAFRTEKNISDSRIRALERWAASLNASHAAMRDNITSQIGRHQQDVQTLEDKLTNCSVRVAFHATLSTHQNLRIGRTVMYDTIELNQGDAYDNSTGVFTCASPGVYLFNAHAMSKDSTSKVALNMKLNNDIVSGLTAGISDNVGYDHGSMSAVMDLRVGDVVKVVVANITSYLFHTFDGAVKLNGFNGHIVHPDACQP